MISSCGKKQARRYDFGRQGGEEPVALLLQQQTYHREVVSDFSLTSVQPQRHLAGSSPKLQQGWLVGSGLAVVHFV